MIVAKGRGAETRRYLSDFVARLGLADRRVVRDSGHLTRCRREDAPLRKGRVLVVGDAAGLLEPWTREGISYALRSGTWAGQVAARASTPSDLAEYDQSINQELVPEMVAGRRLVKAFARRRSLMHAAMATPFGWHAFEAFCNGDLSMTDVLQRPAVRAAISLLGGRTR
nr:hypothetical protein GCM10020092_104320 [Actinoplanes digitatis]